MGQRSMRGLVLVIAFIALLIPVTSVEAKFPSEFRTIDGEDNNNNQVDWGRARTALLRLTLAEYADGLDSPAGPDRPSARLVSNEIHAQGEAIIPNEKHASDFVWQWGQFLDHDIDLTESALPDEPFDIPVPAGDPFFDPMETGSQFIYFSRSIYTHDDEGVRQQLNEITAYIDASNVYGSDHERNEELRAFDSTGRLKTSPGDLLPFNVNNLPNAGGPDPTLFLAGDVRANEQVGLTAMHTLFVREHNRWANEMRERFPSHGSEYIYHIARLMVGAEIQAITYNEWLPIVLGPNALSEYKGYNPNVNAGISNAFSTAAFRFGHSMLSPILMRLDAEGQPIEAGHLPLQRAFFNPDEIINNGGIEPILRGLGSQVAQKIDIFIVDAVRNFLFGEPGQGGFDLPSLNIQRGRDHGLCSYNQVRLDYGLPPVASFADISSDPTVQQKLAKVYSSVDDLDLLVAGLAEDHVPGALVGETFYTILKNQFERLRDGDRFWYQLMSAPDVQRIEQRTLARIIRDNTTIGESEIKENVFIAP